MDCPNSTNQLIRQYEIYFKHEETDHKSSEKEDTIFTIWTSWTAVSEDTSMGLWVPLFPIMTNCINSEL